MRQQYRLITCIYLTGIVVLFLSGCNLPSQAAPTLAPEAEYTMAAETIVAELTRNAPVETQPINPSPTQPPVEAPASTTPVDTLAPSPSVVLPTNTPAPTLTPPATATSPAEPTAAGEVLYEDDFKRQGRWYEDAGDDFGFEYQDEAYLIYVNISNAPIWSIRDQILSDVILEVDAVRQSGPQSGYFGLVCRHQDGENYYALVISSDGRYGIAKMERGEFEFLKEGKDDGSIIQLDDEVNRIRAVCIGERLALYANSQLLVEVEDDDISKGVVGLIAGTRQQDGLEALFDNFIIIEP